MPKKSCSICHMPQTLMSFLVSLCHGKWKTTKPGVTARSCATMPPEPTEVESSQVSFVSSMAATAANMDSNGRLRMASMAMAEVRLERGSDTTHKQNLAATHAHCTAGYSWPRVFWPTQFACVCLIFCRSWRNSPWVLVMWTSQGMALAKTQTVGSGWITQKS